MPISTFSGLHTAFSGVNISARNLDITGKNIANVGTDGYSRQRVTQEGIPSPYGGIWGDPLMPPGGVTITGYQRVRDALLDRRFYDQAPLSADARVRVSYMVGVEGTFGEPGELGLNNTLDKFWNSWLEASNAPTNAAARQSVIDRTVTLADTIRSIAANLTATGQQVDDQQAALLTEVNEISGQIETLTRSIRLSIAHSETPNDLLDQRDLLLDRLAEIGNISVNKFDDGSLDITIGSAALMTGGVAAPITATDLNTTTAGEFHGLQTLNTVTVPNILSQLDAIAQAVITQVNTLHTSGFDLSGSPGGNVFTGTDASTIGVDAGWRSSTSNVALSTVAGSVANGSNGIAISDIADAAGTVSGASIRGAYQSLVQHLGSTVQNAQRDYRSLQLQTDIVMDRRDSVSGVSLDEEMSNLIQYQTGYSAAARAVSAIDEMLDVLVNRTGKVGL